MIYLEKLDEKITNAKILIIDEDVNMMEILTSVLNNYGHTVSTFTEPISAIEELKAHRKELELEAEQERIQEISMYQSFS